jgi:hypothetical protein
MQQCPRDARGDCIDAGIDVGETTNRRMKDPGGYHPAGEPNVTQAGLELQAISPVGIDIAEFIFSPGKSLIRLK